MWRKIIILYLLGGEGEAGNAIFGRNPHFVVLIFNNRLYDSVGQSVFNTITIESQMLVVISRIADGKACSRCSNPHISFMIIHQTADFIAGECFIDMIVKYVILGGVDQWVRMEDINTVVGTHPHHTVAVFLYDAYPFFSITALKEMLELITVACFDSQIQSSAKCSYPHPPFAVTVD